MTNFPETIRNRLNESDEHHRQIKKIEPGVLAGRRYQRRSYSDFERTLDEIAKPYSSSTQPRVTPSTGNVRKLADAYKDLYDQFKYIEEKLIRAEENQRTRYPVKSDNSSLPLTLHNVTWIDGTRGAGPSASKVSDLLKSACDIKVENPGGYFAAIEGTPEKVDTYLQLVELLNDLTTSLYIRGVEDGKKLLVQLAAGDISPEDFDASLLRRDKK